MRSASALLVGCHDNVHNFIGIIKHVQNKRNIDNIYEIKLWSGEELN